MSCGSLYFLRHFGRLLQDEALLVAIKPPFTHSLPLISLPSLLYGKSNAPDESKALLVDPLPFGTAVSLRKDLTCLVLILPVPYAGLVALVAIPRVVICLTIHEWRYAGLQHVSALARRESHRQIMPELNGTRPPNTNLVPLPCPSCNASHHVLVIGVGSSRLRLAFFEPSLLSNARARSAFVRLLAVASVWLLWTSRQRCQWSLRS